MLQRLAPLAVSTLAAVLVSCGGNDAPAPRFATSTTPSSEPPPLARPRVQEGEFVFSGAASPMSYAPFELDGTYVVRFEQYAPEDPDLDFAGQTPFTANLRAAGSRGAGFELFGAARATGRRTLTKRGRYVLDVTFGDFPFAVRFTPRR